MSGPKTSSYTLTTEQRRALEKQQELRLLCVNKRNELLRSRRYLQKLSSMFSEDIRIAEMLSERTGKDNGFKREFSELERIVAFEEPLNVMDEASLDEIENALVQVRKRIEQASQLSDTIKVITKRNDAELWENLQKTITAGFGLSFGNLLTEKDAAFRSTKEAVGKELKELCRLVEIPTETREEVLQAIRELEVVNEPLYLNNFTAITVKPIKKKCAAFIRSYKQYHEVFEKRYAEYITLCENLQMTWKKLVCTEESVKFLTKEIIRMRALIIESDEQAYIREAMDAVMTEMGYSVIGYREIEKRTGRRFRNDLFSYEGGTAVNVTYSSDGRIAMELAGLDECEREPDKDEKLLLCEKMEDFCDSFTEIEKRLAQRGVILKRRIAILPPSEEYAQVIGTEAYHMHEQAEHFSVKKRKATQKAGSQYVEI